MLGQHVLDLTPSRFSQGQGVSCAVFSTDEEAQKYPLLSVHKLLFVFFISKSLCSFHISSMSSEKLQKLVVYGRRPPTYKTVALNVSWKGTLLVNRLSYLDLNIACCCVNFCYCFCLSCRQAKRKVRNTQLSDCTGV